MEPEIRTSHMTEEAKRKKLHETPTQPDKEVTEPPEPVEVAKEAAGEVSDEHLEAELGVEEDASKIKAKKARKTH